MSDHDKKELNFELNLLPVISMMSVCICFLLLTAVWTNIGSMNIEHGLGQSSGRQDQKESSMWITMEADHNSGTDKSLKVTLKMMDSPGLPASLVKRDFSLAAEGARGWSELDLQASQIKRALPGLKTALIMPQASVNYGDVIRVMDRLKGLKIGEIGIAPL